MKTDPLVPIPDLNDPEFAEFLEQLKAQAARPIPQAGVAGADPAQGKFLDLAKKYGPFLIALLGRLLVAA